MVYIYIAKKDHTPTHTGGAHCTIHHLWLPLVQSGVASILIIPHPYIVQEGYRYFFILEMNPIITCLKMFKEST